MSYIIYGYVECHFAECVRLSVILLSVIMVNVIMLSVVEPINQSPMLLSFHDRNLRVLVISWSVCPCKNSRTSQIFVGKAGADLSEAPSGAPL